MKNKEWLAKQLETLPPDECWEKLEWLMREFPKQYNDERLAVTVWLEDNHITTREEHIRQIDEELREYRKRLESEAKTYDQTFSACAINQRKSREAALGACAMTAIDKVKELSAGKPLKRGTLTWRIEDGITEDEGGQKLFVYQVAYHVASEERAYSDEDIDKEIGETFERMMRETDEMFPPEDKDEQQGQG